LEVGDDSRWWVHLSAKRGSGGPCVSDRAGGNEGAAAFVARLAQEGD
jgi:hypothetical protein